MGGPGAWGPMGGPGAWASRTHGPQGPVGLKDPGLKDPGLMDLGPMGRGPRAPRRDISKISIFPTTHP